MCVCVCVCVCVCACVRVCVRVCVTVCCVSPRPGQEKLEDPVLVETTSEASAPSMSDVLLVVVGGEGGELSRSEPDSLSLTSQTSSVETTSALSTVPPPSSLASSEPAAMTLHHSEGREKEVGVGEGEKPSSQASSETTTKPKMDSTPSHREKEKGVREGEVGDGSVEIQQEVLMDTQLLVDTTDSTSDSLCVEGEGGGGGGSVMFQDQQLLTEVFAGGEATCELGEIGEGEGGNGEKEREERDDKSGNYSVELSSSDQFTLLIQSSESNLARIRYTHLHTHTHTHTLCAGLCCVYCVMFLPLDLSLWNCTQRSTHYLSNTSPPPNYRDK